MYDGDFDTDGDLDGVDLETFASAFVVYDPAADFNNDTSIDAADMQVRVAK